MEQFAYASQCGFFYILLVGSLFHAKHFLRLRGRARCRPLQSGYEGGVVPQETTPLGARPQPESVGTRRLSPQCGDQGGDPTKGNCVSLLGKAFRRGIVKLVEKYGYDMDLWY